MMAAYKNCCVRLLLALALSCLPLASSHAACTGQDLSSWAVESAAQADVCLANFDPEPEQCANQLCERIREWRKLPQLQKEDRATELLLMIQADLTGNTRVDPVLANRLSREIDRWLGEMRLAPDAAHLVNSANRWRYSKPAKKIIEEQDHEIDIGAALSKGCVSAASCTAALRSSAELIVYANDVKIVADGLGDGRRLAGAKYFQMLDKRWSNYLGASRFQYPWELAVNSWRFDIDGHKGFVSPPEDQVIFLHPSAAMRYHRDGEQKFEKTLVLEVLGYHRWRWEGSDAKHAYGGSLIMAWTGAKGESKPGWGAMMHLPKNYSIGLIRQSTTGGHRTSLLLNVDLAKLFEDKQAVIDKFTKPKP